MIIATIQDDELEDELEIDIGTQADALILYRWNGAQYAFVKRHAGKPFIVPSSVSCVKSFSQWIKSLNKKELSE